MDGPATLACGELWCQLLAPGENATIECHLGELWLTMEGDALDHILVGGDKHVATGPGKLIVQSLTRAMFDWRIESFGQMTGKLEI